MLPTHAAGSSKTIYVVMGVSGSGKTKVGSALARALDIDFVEGDDYHPVDNVRRMSQAIPLTDDDRITWLRALAAKIREAKAAGIGLVMTCSALKRAYRDVLRGAGEVQLIFLRGPRALIAERLAKRRGHFMPPALLDSQFAILEEPTADENPWVCDIMQSPEDLVAALVSRVAGAST